MNPGQQNFYNFILARAQEGKAEEAKALLLENFKLQDEGGFTKEVMGQNVMKLMALVKPEHLDELKQAAAHMGGTLGN